MICWPTFTCTSSTRWSPSRVVEIRLTISAAATSLADAIERALPAPGRSGAFDILIAAYSLAAAFWHIANPPERLSDVYAKEPEALPPEWNIDFASALTRVLTATCVGLSSGSPATKARCEVTTVLRAIRADAAKVLSAPKQMVG